jgi:AraC-like DNA-binding protein
LRCTTETLTRGANVKLNGTVSVLAARPAVDALDKRGIDVEPALRAAQLSREALASNENRLPHQSVQRLWEAAAEAAHDRFFGVHVAEALPTGAYDLIDYLLSTAATVGEGLARLTHYVRLIYDHSDWKLVIEPRHVRLIRRVAAPAPQYDEFSLTLLLVRSRQSSGTHWTPERMIFQHERAGDDGELARVFACPIAFGAADTELRFAPSIMLLAHTRPDSRLLAILTRYADSLLTSLPSRGDLVASVSSTIARQMAKELPSLPSTAAAVRLPERTLQRRLAEKGASHSKLVDEVRRDLALKYLGDAGLSIGEIAYLLHFADSTALHRAFRRWTGEAPAQYRRRLFEALH